MNLGCNMLKWACENGWKIDAKMAEIGPNLAHLWFWPVNKWAGVSLIGNWFVTVIFCHRKWVRAGLTRPRALSWRFKTVTVYVNPWWFSTNRHACQSMMLNLWWFLKPSQMLFTDGFSVIRDENFPSWINRILVVAGWEWAREPKR